MTDYIEEPSGEAQQLLDSPMLNRIFDALETENIERGINAAHSEHETRLHAAMEVQAIRSVRRQLAAKAAGKAKPMRTGPAA